MDENASGGVLEAAQRRAGRWGTAAYVGTASLVVLAAVGLVGLAIKQPLLIPSLGPTAILFFGTPTQKVASLRNTLLGHGVAIVAGMACLLAFGLLDHPSVLDEGLTAPRLACAALSVALTAVVLCVIKASHPPAGATTLIVSLGLLTTPTQLMAIAGAVLLTSALGFGLNRLLRVRQPLA